MGVSIPVGQEGRREDDGALADVPRAHPQIPGRNLRDEQRNSRVQTQRLPDAEKQTILSTFSARFLIRNLSFLEAEKQRGMCTRFAQISTFPEADKGLRLFAWFYSEMCSPAVSACSL